jgi:hypothetical protein
LGENLMPSNFMPVIPMESDFKLKSGVKVRMLRREPFKFFGEIEKWCADLNVGEILAFQMNTDPNGWTNLAICYREYKEPVIAPDKMVDPIIVLYDTVALLRDTVEEINKLSASVNQLQKTISVPLADSKQEENGAD